MRAFGSVLSAAERIGCDANHVYYLINIGTLYAFKVRWIYRVDMTTVEAYAARRPERGIDRFTPRYPEHPGYLFCLEYLNADGTPRTQAPGRPAGLPGGRGMERDPCGIPCIPVAQRHPVTPRPVQYELAIA